MAPDSSRALGAPPAIRTMGPRLFLNRSGHCVVSTTCGWVTTGGMLVVLNGTGAGQVRRVVREPAFYGKDWVLDSPLDPIDFGSSGSYVQIASFRGRSVYESNTFRDVGAFQIWGTGIDTLVVNNVNERTAGMISWGQWRGYTGILDGRLAAVEGQGAQPALRNLFQDNTFLEPGVVNYATSHTPMEALTSGEATFLASSLLMWRALHLVFPSTHGPCSVATPFMPMVGSSLTVLLPTSWLRATASLSLEDIVAQMWSWESALRIHHGTSWSVGMTPLIPRALPASNIS